MKYEIYKLGTPNIFKKVESENPRKAISNALDLKESDLEITKVEQFDANFCAKSLGEKRNTNNFFFVKRKEIKKVSKSKTDNIDDILAKASKKLDKKNLEDTQRKYNKCKKLVEQIQKNKEKIEEVITISEKLMNFYNSRFESDQVSAFFTESFYHNLGIYVKSSKYSTGDLKCYLGYEAGGACGKYPFYTDGTEVYPFTNGNGDLKDITYFESTNTDAGYKEYKEPITTFTVRKLSSFLEDFKNFSDFIDSKIEYLKK